MKIVYLIAFTLITITLFSLDTNLVYNIVYESNDYEDSTEIFTVKSFNKSDHNISSNGKTVIVTMSEDSKKFPKENVTGFALNKVKDIDSDTDDETLMYGEIRFNDPILIQQNSKLTEISSDIFSRNYINKTVVSNNLYIIYSYTDGAEKKAPLIPVDVTNVDQVVETFRARDQNWYNFRANIDTSNAPILIHGIGVGFTYGLENTSHILYLKSIGVRDIEKVRSSKSDINFRRSYYNYNDDSFIRRVKFKSNIKEEKYLFIENKSDREKLYKINYAIGRVIIVGYQQSYNLEINGLDKIVAYDAYVLLKPLENRLVTLNTDDFVNNTNYTIPDFFIVESPQSPYGEKKLIGQGILTSPVEEIE